MSAPTPQQQEAIAARGNVLVAAGAGTGKTSTLTARCLRLVLEEGCPLSQILMVTFTEAAAAEMRERIRKALHTEAERWGETHGEPRQAAREDARPTQINDHLAEELALLDTAPISTLHSFCLDLVRRNFHALGLDPQFTVLDEAQTKPLIHSVLNELFERHYAGKSEFSSNVRELVRCYGGGRDDGIRQFIVKIHQHTQAMAAPEKWFEEQTVAFGDQSPAARRKTFIDGVAEWAPLWRDVLVATAEDNSNMAACWSALAALPDSAMTFKQAAEVLRKIVAADEGEWERGTKSKIRKPLEAFFNDARFLSGLISDGGAPLAEDWAWSRASMLTLLQLAREFGEEFAKAKHELGGVDFADQEQFALRLLYDEQGQITSIAQACRECFRFVFVDECQDINAAQDAILRAVSREGRDANRFLVGDVKQSIYRFRLADPRIFQNYENSWKKPTADGECKPLSENFRSRKALLRFINPLFRSLMRPVIGGLDYGADSELRFGNPEGRAKLSLAANILPDEIAPRVELHVIAKESGAEVQQDAADGDGRFRELADLQTTEREARFVAQRLKALKETGHRIWHPKRNCFEAVEYRDMVVLMRGVVGRAEIFAKAFHQAGVPLHAERAGFLKAIEVTDLLNLLRLLDNPLQDVPLLAVLRSPLVGLSADELVQVRLAQRHGLLWFALRKVGEAKGGGGNNALFNKVNCFLKQWKAWRELIRHSSLTHCLETALKETHYEALLLAGERGTVLVANVRRLIDLARRFDPYQREGLFRFLQFIEEQEEAEVRHEPAALDHENAVRLMTIHASKGLEFPVVIVAGLGTKFNTRDLSADILLSEDLGLCPKVLPPESRRRYPSIAHWVAAQRERRALLGEEMRLLYVALTRARDTLILTGTSAKRAEIKRWKEVLPVTDYALIKSASCLDWLRLWFVQDTRPGQWTGEREGANDLLNWKFHDPHDASFVVREDATGIAGSSLKLPSVDELNSLTQLLAWRYSDVAATVEPAKTSVSGLRRRAIEVDDEAVKKFQVSSFKFQAKRRAGKLSAAEIGTAHHTFMQLVSLDRVASELDLRNEGARMEQAGALTTEEMVALDFVAFADFWKSKLGLRLREKQAQVHREMPFTVRMSAADLRALNLYPSNLQLAEEEFVVVQGVADLVVMLPKEIWLLDFKTDDVRAGDLAAKSKYYESQLKSYALAFSRIYAKPVTECWLHFLSCRETIRVAL